MKIIKLKLSNLELKEWEENLPEVISQLPWLEEVFDIIINHDDNYYQLEQLQNGLFIFCNIIGKYKTIGKVKIELCTIPHSKSGFWDKTIKNANTLLENFISSNENGEEAIKIYFINTPIGKEPLAGFYFPKRNVLILQDITHSDININLAINILEQLKELLPIKKVNNIKNNTQKNIEVKVGCDPEFQLWDLQNSSPIPASSIFQFEGKIGTDGTGDQLELRPDPGSPAEVIRNIYSLLKEICMTTYYDIRFNGPCSYGGHIHIGVGFPVKPYHSLLEALDDFIGKPTAKLCQRGSYGELSDFEVKNWGFEYRTPSALIFSKPCIAKIALKIAKLITEKAIKEEKLYYNDPPTINDYINLGLTSLEAKKWINFIKNPPSDNNSMLYFWKIRNTDKFKIGIRFHDEWKEEVKEKIKKEISNIELDYPLIINLFGLAKIRGKVNTILVPGYDIIEHSYANKTSIGVAREIREGKNINTFIKALKEYIQNIINKTEEK